METSRPFHRVIRLILLGAPISAVCFCVLYILGGVFVSLLRPLIGHHWFLATIEIAGLFAPLAASLSLLATFWVRRCHRKQHAPSR